MTIKTNLEIDLRGKVVELKNFSNQIDINNLKEEFEIFVISKIGETTYNRFILSEYLQKNSPGSATPIDIILRYLKNWSNDIVKQTIIENLGARDSNEAEKILKSVKNKEISFIKWVVYIKNSISQFVGKLSSFNSLINNLKNSPDVKNVLYVLDKTIQTNSQAYNKFWTDIENWYFPESFARWASNYPEFRKVVDIFRDLAEISKLISEYKEELSKLKDKIDEFRSYKKFFGPIDVNQVTLSKFERYSILTLKEDLETILKNKYIYSLLDKIENKFISKQTITNKDVQDFIKNGLDLNLMKNVTPQDLESLVIILWVFLETWVISNKNADKIRKYIFILSQIAEYMEWNIDEIDTLKWVKQWEYSSLPTWHKEKKYVVANSELLYSYVKTKYLPESLKKNIEKYEKVSVVASIIAILLNSNIDLSKRQKAFADLKRYINTLDWKKLKNSLDEYTKAYFEYILEPALKTSNKIDEFETKYEKLVKKVVAVTNFLELYLDRLKVNYSDEYKDNKNVRKVEQMLMDWKLYGWMNPNILVVFNISSDLYYQNLPNFSYKLWPGEGFVTQVVNVINNKLRGDLKNNYDLIANLEEYFYEVNKYKDIYYYLFKLDTDWIFWKDEKKRLNETGILTKYISLSISTLQRGFLDRSRIVRASQQNVVEYINEDWSKISIDISDFEKKKDNLKKYIIQLIANKGFQDRFKSFFPLSSAKINFMDQDQIDQLANLLTGKYIQLLEYFYIADVAGKTLAYEDIYEFYKYYYVIFGNISGEEVLKILNLDQSLIKKLKEILSKVNFLNQQNEGENEENSKNFIEKILWFINSGPKWLNINQIDNVLNELFSDEEQQKQFDHYIEEIWDNSPLYLRQAICEASWKASCSSSLLSSKYIPLEVKYYLIKRILISSALQTISKNAFYSYIYSLKWDQFELLKIQIDKLKFTLKDQIALYALSLVKEAAKIFAAWALTELTMWAGIPLLVTALESTWAGLLATRLYTGARFTYWIANGLRWYYTTIGKWWGVLHYGKNLVVEPFWYSVLSWENFLDVAPYWWFGMMWGAAVWRIAKIAWKGVEEMGLIRRSLLIWWGWVGAIGVYDYLRWDFSFSALPHQFVFMLLLLWLEKWKWKITNTKFYKWAMESSASLYDSGRAWANNRFLWKQREVKIWNNTYKVASIWFTRMPKDSVSGRILWGEYVPYYILENGKLVIDRKPGIIRNRNIGERYKIIDGIELKVREWEYILNMSGSNVVIVNPKEKIIKVYSPLEGWKLTVDNQWRYIYTNQGTSYRAYFINRIIKETKGEKIVKDIEKMIKPDSNTNYVIIDNLWNVYKVLKGWSAPDYWYSGSNTSWSGQNSWAQFELKLIWNIYDGNVRLVKEIKIDELYNSDGSINVQKIKELDEELKRIIWPQWEEQVIGKTPIEKLRGIHYSILKYLEQKGISQEELLNKFKVKVEEIKILTVDDIKKNEEFIDIKNKIFEPLKRKRQQRWMKPKEAEKKALSDTKKLLTTSLSLVAGIIKFPLVLLKWTAVATLVWWVAIWIDYRWDHHLDMYDWIKEHFPDLVDSAVTGGEVFLWTYWLGKILSWIWLKWIWEFLERNWFKIALTAAGVKLLLDVWGKEYLLWLLGWNKK